MKVKSWPIILKVFTIISVVLTLSLVGCTKSEVEEDELSIFDTRAVQILSSSLVEMPKSLLEGSDEADKDMSMTNIDLGLNAFAHQDNVDMNALNFNLDKLDAPVAPLNRDYGALYDVSRNYVGAAAAAKGKILMFIQSFIAKLGMLKDVDLPVVMEESLVAKFGFYKIVVGVPDTEEYRWQISLYYTAASSEPEVAFFLNISEKGGKGRMFMKMIDEVDGYAASAGIPNITMTSKVEVLFDGTIKPKKFEFKYVGDRTKAREHAETYSEKEWQALDDASKDALTKIPDKIFLTINHDEDKQEFSVYGASYHPGWALLEKLEGKAFWNDEARTIYSFKAKSSKAGKGAKLALALPSQTSHNPDVWETDSVGSVFSGVVKAQLDDTLRRLSDDINDHPPTVEDPLNDPPNTPPTYAGSEFVEKLKATVMFDCIMDNCDLGGSNDALPPNPAITLDNLERFVYHPPIMMDLFQKVAGLHQQCRVVSYMVNPAFFRDDIGLAGSYNADTKKFYKYSSSSGSFGSGIDNTDSVSDLMDLSLDDVGFYTPAYIKQADIAR